MRGRKDFLGTTRLVLLLLLIPFLRLLFWMQYRVNTGTYFDMILEDGPVEWLTFYLLAATGLISLLLVLRRRKEGIRRTWFFLLFGIFCLGCAWEEVSWGQRIFGVETTPFFMEHSDQQEINVHNVMQQWSGIKTKDVAAILLSIYGILLPLVARRGKLAGLLKRWSIPVPPWWLIPGFVLAAYMTKDHLTGHEEEIAEFFYSLCFFLFIAEEHARAEREDGASRLWKPLVALGVACAVVTPLVVFVFTGFPSNPDEVRLYFHRREVARFLAPDTRFVTSKDLDLAFPFAYERLSWRRAAKEYESHPVDVIVDSISSLNKAKRKILGQMRSTQPYGLVYFDGDIFVLRRGHPGAYPEELDRFLRATLKHLCLEGCWVRAGENRFVKGASWVRYFKGGDPEDQPLLAYAKSRTLPAGDFVAVLRYRGRPGKEAGRFYLYFHNTDRLLHSEPLAAHAETDDFVTQSFAFTLEEETPVEVRVIGDEGPVWLDYVRFEAADGQEKP